MSRTFNDPQALRRRNRMIIRLDEFRPNAPGKCPKRQDRGNETDRDAPNDPFAFHLPDRLVVILVTSTVFAIVVRG
jgi:hypothetical protein